MPIAVRAAMLFALVGIVVPSISSAQKVGVEVWVHGSGIETPRNAATKALRDCIEAAVSRSSDLELSAADAGSFQILIPQEVILAHDADVSYVLFTATITVAMAAYSSQIYGYCRHDDLESCANEVIAALREMRRTSEGKRSPLR